MSKAKLDKNEARLLKTSEADGLESVLTPARKKQAQEAATHTFKKDKQINIRISSRDLDTIQKPHSWRASLIKHEYPASCTSMHLGA